MKNLVLHIKYPYTAAIIAIMWIGTALMIGIQQTAEAEILVMITAAASLVVAVAGFASPK